MEAQTSQSLRQLRLDASKITGSFKPLQSTNYVLSADLGSNLEEIRDTKSRLVKHWKESYTKLVLVYHPPDLFQGMKILFVYMLPDLADR